MLLMRESRSAVYFFQLAFQNLKRRQKGTVCRLMAALTSSEIRQCWV